MKTMKLIFTQVLSMGLVIILFQGCYTRVATIQEEESSYQQEEQQAPDSSYEHNDYDNWQSHNYIGFSYYYPQWHSYWGWEGCIYPTYWDHGGGQRYIPIMDTTHFIPIIGIRILAIMVITTHHMDIRIRLVRMEHATLVINVAAIIDGVMEL